MKIFCLLIVFALALSPMAYGVAVGASPARLEISNVLHGGYAERSFRVSTDSQETLFGHFSVQGSIEDWISFEDNITRFNATTTSPREVTIIVRPPPETPPGRYTGGIEVIGDTTGTIAGRAGSIVRTSVLMGIAVDVTGEETRSCKAGAFQFQDVERGKPLELWLTLENSGNVLTSPLVSFDLFDRERKNLVLSADLRTPQTLPTQNRRYFLNHPNILETGQYWATVEVPECDAETLLTFSVVEKGEIADQGMLTNLDAKQEATTLETIPVTATFSNTGQRVVTSYLKATVKLDGRIVAVIESDRLAVNPGENVKLEAFFTPEKPGRYEISGRVIYNEKLTFEKGLTISVTEEEKKSTLLTPLLAYVVVVVAAFFVLKKMRQKKISK